MKKTLFTLLLALAMVVCFCVFTVSAEETTEHVHCVCGGSAVGVQDHECEDITWTPISEAIAQTYYTKEVTNTETGEVTKEKVYRTVNTADLGKLPSGNYYLDTDVKVTYASAFSKGNDVKICLVFLS